MSVRKCRRIWRIWIRLESLRWSFWPWWSREQGMNNWWACREDTPTNAARGSVLYPITKHRDDFVTNFMFGRWIPSNAQNEKGIDFDFNHQTAPINPFDYMANIAEDKRSNIFLETDFLVRALGFVCSHKLEILQLLLIIFTLLFVKLSFGSWRRRRGSLSDMNL